jgi:cytochrome oxidase assembly protein ShyY1
VRFLLSRRWVLFAVAVAVMALGAVRLGAWQFDRLEDREQRNEWTERNLAAEPAPVDAVLAVGQPVPADREWTRVEVTGDYDADATVVVRYQTRDGEPGVDLVTPLVTAGGTAVLVDRGWVPTDNTGTVPADLPQPPSGEVDVVGWVRADATGRGVQVESGSTRAISSVEIGEALDYPLYAGFVDAQSETPPPTDEVQRTELPDLGEGPHFFYGLQWWFFGVLAVFGFGYLAWDETRQRRRTREAGHAREEPVRRA